MFRGIQIIASKPSIDFMSKRVIALVLSSLLIVASMVDIAVQGLNLGIDFAGGVLIEVKSDGPADLAGMRSTLAALALGDVQLQGIGEAGDEVMIRVPAQVGDERVQMAALNAVREALGEDLEYRRTELVGPKVGGELISAGIWAVGLALLGIAIYIWLRFEWPFAVGAIFALFHDVITTVGIFALLGLQFDLTIVAAIMTIAGYSINDTVVNYDRVRENMRRYRAMPMVELLNLSTNEMLARTIVTGLTTLLAVVAIFVFGGDVLRGFAFALIWGVVVGTLSSVYVAMPLLLYLNIRPNGGEGEKAAAEATP